jgi:4-hydroxyphenylacetate 3-monooxygenase
MYAALYDLKADPAKRETMSFEEDGERYSLYFMMPRSREDLVRRTACHKAIADFSHGLLGRSPDHVASSFTGLAMRPEVFDSGGARAIKFSERHELLQALPQKICSSPTRSCRRRAPPVRNYEQDRQPPTLRVTKEDDSGVTLNGMKMLATGAVFADEVIIGNILPLAPSQVKESVTCAVPIAAPGLTLWARKPLSMGTKSRADAPLSSVFDETDSWSCSRT